MPGRRDAAATAQDPVSGIALRERLYIRASSGSDFEIRSRVGLVLRDEIVRARGRPIDPRSGSLTFVVELTFMGASPSSTRRSRAGPDPSLLILSKAPGGAADQRAHVVYGVGPAQLEGVSWHRGQGHRHHTQNRAQASPPPPRTVPLPWSTTVLVPPRFLIMISPLPLSPLVTKAA